MYKSIKYFILFAAVSIVGCSFGSGPETGGTVFPNNIKGNVYSLESGALASADVTVSKISISGAGEVQREMFETESDENGFFSFDNLEQGTYAVYASSVGVSGVSSVFEINGTSEVDTISVFMNRENLLMGRIVDYNSYSFVFIPGLKNSIEPDENGFYVLENVPAGKYDIVFVSQASVNYLPVIVSQSTDTVFLRDVKQDDNIVKSYSPINTTIENSSAVLFVEYAQGEEPQWYEGKNFDDVSYISSLVDNEFIFYNIAASMFWHDGFSWLNQSVPTLGSRVFIKSGVCIVDEPIDSSTIYIEKDGKLSINDIDITSNGDIILEGGLLSFILDNSDELQFSYNIESSYGTSYIDVEGRSPDDQVDFFGAIRGSATIEKQGESVMHLEGDATEFSGNWIIREGKLRVKIVGSLGSGSVVVYPGTRLDNEAIQGLADLERVELIYNDEIGGGIIELDRPSTVNELVIDGELMPPGKYYEEFDDTFFRGRDTLTVLD